MTNSQTHPEVTQEHPSNVIQMTPMTSQTTVLDTVRNHTISSIAADCDVSRDKLKAIHKKAVSELGELGRKLNKQWFFSDAEKAQIVEFSGLQDLTQAKKVESALSVEVQPVDNILDTYDPVQFLATTRHYKAADDSAQIDQGNQALTLLMQQAQADDNAATAALVQQAQNRGRKLGAMLAQVEIGTAMQEKQAVKNAFFEANGVVDKAEN